MTTPPWLEVAFRWSDQGDVFAADPDRAAARLAYDEALQHWFAYADAHPDERNQWGGPLPDWDEYLDAYLENLDRANQKAYERAIGATVV